MTTRRFFLRVIFDLSLLSSCFSLLGGYEGATPLYSTFRHAQNLLLGIHVFAEGEGKIHRGFPVLLFGFLIDTFRNDTLPSSFPKSLIGNPEVLFFPFCPSIGNHRRVSHHYSRNLGVNPNTFKNHGPLIEPFRGRLKAA